VSAIDPEFARERPVFVTQDDRRARWLRRVAVAATALACAWLVALGVGVLGLGSLPGLSLVKGETARQAHRPSAVEHARRAPAVAPGSVASDARRAATTTRTSAVAASAQAQSARSARRARAAARPAAPPAAPPPAAQTPVSRVQPVNPAQRQRGWARSGQTAPRGQLRKTQPPPPPPATARGRRVGQATPAAPAPLPPGQAKKTELEPPPG